MKIAFSKMATQRLEKQQRRFRDILANVTDWTPKQRNRYKNLVVICNLLADRKENSTGGLSLSERFLNGLVEHSEILRVRVIPPWKKLNFINNGKKEISKTTSTNSVDSKKGIGKRHQANGKKLQDKNRSGTRKVKNLSH